MTKTRSLTLCEETDYLLSDMSWQARFIFATPQMGVRKSLLLLGVDTFTYRARPGAITGGAGRGFWHVYADSLRDILTAAHKSWRDKQKRCAELQQRTAGKALDRQRGKALCLNLAWERVRKLFAEHHILL